MIKSLAWLVVELILTSQLLERLYPLLCTYKQRIPLLSWCANYESFWKLYTKTQFNTFLFFTIGTPPIEQNKICFLFSFYNWGHQILSPSMTDQIIKLPLTSPEKEVTHTQKEITYENKGWRSQGSLNENFKVAPVIFV